jgi:predicted Zn-dependent protease
MPPRTENELSAPLRSHWLKAVAAVEVRNFAYAISLLQEILKQEPEFLRGRELLRRTAITRQKAEKKSFFHTSLFSILKARQQLKKDPKRAIEMIEKVLENEPSNRQANLLLKEAAMMAGWPEIAVFALQTLLEEKPRDTRILHKLARLYHELGRSDEEAAAYDKITAVDPIDAEAVRLGKDAAARASIQTGRWEAGGKRA